MPDDDVIAELERLRAENAQLKRTANRGVSLKVSEKGGLSVYGLGRFPVTLYKEQWTSSSTWPTTSVRSFGPTRRASDEELMSPSTARFPTMTSDVRCTAVRHSGLITMHLGSERTGDYPHVKLSALLANYPGRRMPS